MPRSTYVTPVAYNENFLLEAQGDAVTAGEHSLNAHYSFWQYYNTASSTVATLGIALYGVHADL
jgi:hypothetical protein